jgi:hypothetical protein
VLKECELLGEGAFSRVSQVSVESSSRTFALKRMTKTAALQCPEHVYCEQHISKNTTNAFCIRQYASFKVSGVYWPVHQRNNATCLAAMPLSTVTTSRCSLGCLACSCWLFTWLLLAGKTPPNLHVLVSLCLRCGSFAGPTPPVLPV